VGPPDAMRGGAVGTVGPCGGWSSCVILVDYLREVFTNLTVVVVVLVWCLGSPLYRAVIVSVRAGTPDAPGT
jgi:hypothetical protein